MTYKDTVREAFKKHKGKSSKEIMKLAAAEWAAQKGGMSMKKKAKGGSIGLGGIAQAIPIATSLIGGVKDLFSSKPDPDKQTQRDYMLREYNRVNGTKFGVQGLHYDVPYGSGLKRGRKARGSAMSAGAMSGGQMSAGSIENEGKLSTGLRGYGSSSSVRGMGSMNRGGTMSGGAASGGGIGDIIGNVLPFLSLL